jgi:CheY-like chemotaxis protein
LILLDLGMPKLDGFEFMTILKSQPDTKDIPIIVISAWTAAYYREKSAESGAVEFLNKPYEIDELIDAVQTHLPH